MLLSSPVELLLLPVWRSEAQTENKQASQQLTSVNGKQSNTQELNEFQVLNCCVGAALFAAQALHSSELFLQSLERTANREIVE